MDLEMKQGSLKQNISIARNKQPGCMNNTPTQPVAKPGHDRPPHKGAGRTLR